MAEFTKIEVPVNPHSGCLDPEETFAERSSADSSGCVSWTGSMNDQGYGMMSYYGKHIRAHRYAWWRANGDIPSGMVIDHLCWNRACVNVEHLRVITRAQNQQNREGANKNSKNGVRGISWDPRTKKWKARVFADGKTHWGGRFADKTEAANTALEMRSRLQPFSQN